MAKVLSLYEMAASKGRVIRQGEIVQMVMDGAGAFVCAAQDFVVAQKWGMSRTGSGNITTDRGRLLDKIEVLISRPNSFVSTRGSSVPIERLAKAMKQAGYDLKEWNISRDVIELIEKRPDQTPMKKVVVEVLPAESPDTPSA
ncbi:MAG: hypothetical protein Q7J29_11555 [Stagnimonas sp.]|nr:hypothetical protein [Stagnimonas sp.]